MALFLRGNVWWFEYRTSHERVVKSTGFRKNDRAKAQAVLDAFRLARCARPKRSVVEGIIDAIYADFKKPCDGILLSSAWTVYEEWMRGKGRVIAPKTIVERRGLVARLVAWAEAKGCLHVHDVDVAFARSFMASMRVAGRSNKTLRNAADVLSGVWIALGQMNPGVHNPWLAARPDNDGSSKRREAFSLDEEARVFAAARAIGHGWYLASMVARWTGQRYGDIATLCWDAVDLGNRIISFVPAKTRRHDLRISIPIADPLYDALVEERNRSGGDGFVLNEHGIKYPVPFDPPFSDVLRDAVSRLSRS